MSELPYFQTKNKIKANPENHYQDLTNIKKFNIAGITCVQELMLIQSLVVHRCPEAKTKFPELFNGSVNRYLVHFGHIFWNCKA